MSLPLDVKRLTTRAVSSYFSAARARGGKHSIDAMKGERFWRSLDRVLRDVTSGLLRKQLEHHQYVSIIATFLATCRLP